MGISRRGALFGITSLAGAVAALWAGRPAAQADAGTTADQPPRISGEEARRKVEKKEAILLDVRGRSSYDQQHADGAIHIPLGELEARLGELPKDKLIAAYCT